MSKLVFETEPKTVVDKYEIEAISDRLMYVYGRFLELRKNRPIDKKRFARCPACQSKHQLEDKVYSAFGVKKNGKWIGNLFACQDCFDKYGETAKQELTNLIQTLEKKALDRILENNLLKLNYSEEYTRADIEQRLTQITQLQGAKNES